MAVAARKDYLKDFWYQDLVSIVNGILAGRTNNSAQITLTQNSATTTITLWPNSLTKDSIIVFSPRTADAATEFGAGSIYISDIDADINTFEITHTNIASTDRVFDYAIIG
ncbi:MAG: hypothetical protein KAS32_02790 [Candidatus Peribacteraceae bacterium]|nr:hypothetical protein [Candidatus Peribacteraceae bacterium]